MKKIGLIINPIAGMGGSVGLKGTDGSDILHEAILRGAKPLAQAKVDLALQAIADQKGQVLFYTAGGDLGENLLRSLGFNYEVTYRPQAKAQDTGVNQGINREVVTSSEDTIQAAQSFLAHNPDLIVFAGGDGTARCIYRALGENVPVLGIPAGVKIHSAVFALSPKLAGETLAAYLKGNTPLVKREVMDIDEAAYRQGKLLTSLYGALSVPLEKKRMQNKKAPSPLSDKAAQLSIAQYVFDEMEDDCYYLLGAGSTVSALKELLGYDSTVLGIDLVYQKKVIAQDLNEQDILEHIKGHKTKLITTPIGGQGFLFGRGNQQVSAKVLQEIGKENIIIVASENKIANLEKKELVFYTGDPATDKEIEGYYRVITSYGAVIVMRVRGI
ncbi:MAG: ATP-NAD kinase family protein [Eubacteriales bacterium]|nr:ATP-NAD kinase family protein [Eubacteriales bacterium]